MKCQCAEKDPACPGPWEPGCQLGTSEEHARVSQQVIQPTAAPSAPAPAEVPMPEPDQTDVDCEVWGQNSKVDVWYRESVLAYAAAREAAERERVRGVLREVANALQATQTWLHPDLSPEGMAARGRLNEDALEAARAELGEGR
ncbi:MAG: hypothetical protein RJA36_2342 [Pseudomonadota bacterium]